MPVIVTTFVDAAAVKPIAEMSVKAIGSGVTSALPAAKPASCVSFSMAQLSVFAVVV
jgi:hypothetical protein